jgi:uncharacterized protein YdbL (DUF1318 family)
MDDRRNGDRQILRRWFMARRFNGIGFLVPFLLTACVTVNIYFPAAEAEEAARTIVRDVIGVQPEDQPPKTKSEPDQSSAREWRTTLWSGLTASLIDVMVAPAHAQADLNINTPAISKLRASLRSRHARLEPYFRNGAVGFTADGFVRLREQSLVPLKDRSVVRKIVADDNQERTALYREIARANGHPEWEKDIRQTFARIWIDEAPGGYWYQAPGGNWQQK